MIDRFLGGAFGGLSCQFCSIVLQSGARLPIHTLQIQSCVCFIRSGVTRYTLLMVLYLHRMCQCILHAVLWSHIGTLMHRLAAEPCSTAGLLFPSRCPSGTILLTPFSMAWDWRVSRAGTMLLYSLFLPSLLSVYRLVLWGWGLWTDRVYITLSQPCTADLF